MVLELKDFKLEMRKINTYFPYNNNFILNKSWIKWFRQKRPNSKHMNKCNFQLFHDDNLLLNIIQLPPALCISMTLCNCTIYASRVDGSQKSTSILQIDLCILFFILSLIIHNLWSCIKFIGNLMSSLHKPPTCCILICQYGNMTYVNKFLTSSGSNEY